MAVISNFGSQSGYGFGASWAIDPNTRRGILVTPGTPGSFPTRDAAEAAARAQTAPSTASAARSGGTPRTPPLRLQNALKALGLTRGDSTLSKIGVDGIIGPATTKAVNYAIAQKYIVMKDFPHADLTLAHVRKFAAGIADHVEAAVKAGGGTFPALPSKKAAGGGGGSVNRAVAFVPPPPETQGFDKKWIWLAVGGVSLLLVLSAAAAAAKRRRAAAAA
jgi:hypothetical protein